MHRGYADRDQREWNRTRHVMQFIINHGGMGGSKYFSPQDIIRLPMDNDIYTPRMITTEKQALELLRDFESALHD